MRIDEPTIITFVKVGAFAKDFGIFYLFVYNYPLVVAVTHAKSFPKCRIQCTVPYKKSLDWTGDFL